VSTPGKPEIISSQRTYAATARPDFVMFAAKVPAGVRLWATRQVPAGVEFGLSTPDGGTSHYWHIEADLEHLLVITRPTYQECMAELFRIWASQDAAAAAAELAPPGRKALPG
jgi:hypothetical protein